MRPLPGLGCTHRIIYFVLLRKPVPGSQFAFALARQCAAAVENDGTSVPWARSHARYADHRCRRRGGRRLWSLLEPIGGRQRLRNEQCCRSKTRLWASRIQRYREILQRHGAMAALDAPAARQRPPNFPFMSSALLTAPSFITECTGPRIQLCCLGRSLAQPILR